MCTSRDTPALCYSLQQDGVVGDGAQLVLRVAVSDVHAVTLALGGGLEWAPAAQRLQTGCTTSTHQHMQTPAKRSSAPHTMLRGGGTACPVT